MGIIKASRLVFDYIRRDEDENIEEVDRAIDDLSVDVEKGTFVAILGHNGSGKSTLAKHINAILVPTEGTVWVSDMDTSDEDKVWEIRRKAGMVFQNPDNQIVGTVVDEDVAFGPENLGVPTDEIRERVEESLGAVGMSAFRDASPNKLSGGQKQRIAIAGILAMEPDCIIMDEPTAMLDPEGRREVTATARRLNREKGITILLITHNMDEAIQADRIYVMDHGKAVMEGTPAEIFAQAERLEKMRLEIPPAAKLARELRKEGFALSDGILTGKELAEELKELYAKRDEEGNGH